MSKQSPHDPDDSIQSQGGKARANKLTPEERSKIASEAAAARWNIPKASHGGTIRIGPWENIQCYNVNRDGEVMRLISQRSFLKMLGLDAGVKGAPKKLNYLLDNPNLRSRGVRDLMKQIETPIKFIYEGFSVFGYDGQIIVEYCKTLMEARRVGGLPDYALDYAEASERIVVSLAGVAIAALIDEATGYQQVREKKALDALLDMYLRKEFSAWAKRFPEEFYKEIFRLRGLEWKGMKVNRPQFIAGDTNDLIYERMEVGIIKELQARNPWLEEKGRRLGYHHCLLTEEFGIPALSQQLHTVISIMKGFPNGKWQRFKEFIDQSLPKKGDSVQFLLDLDVD